jgi:hypothetical protein
VVTRPTYTEVMGSVIDDLRLRTVARVLALPVHERIALACALGDYDLTLFARSNGLDRATALRRLRASRQHGRTPSACTSDDIR